MEIFILKIAVRQLEDQNFPAFFDGIYARQLSRLNSKTSEDHLGFDCSQAEARYSEADILHRHHEQLWRFLQASARPRSVGSSGCCCLQSSRTSAGLDSSVERAASRHRNLLPGQPEAGLHLFKSLACRGPTPRRPRSSYLRSRQWRSASD